MGTLKLQMQITIDGFVGRPEGQSQLDWMSQDIDERALELVYHLADTSDTIIMGRKMSAEFCTYWESVADNNPQSPEIGIARRMVDKPKIIFSKTVKTTKGRNARVENGDLKTVIEKLKKNSSKDILVYGGANFVSSLINENLIDDYYLIVNPVAIGEGMRIFLGTTRLRLVESTAYRNGEVLNHYKPA
jgi:dihydrofolate reductase